jgi:tRNA(His) guanylyltransferase
LLPRAEKTGAAVECSSYELCRRKRGHAVKDDLGDRMKGYEAAATERRFEAGLPVYARIDGRSFSGFTRGMQRPFDPRMTAAMVATTKTLAAETHALIGYAQSDEISLVWLHEEAQSQPLFGGKVHKLTSVLASLAAARFQLALHETFDAAEAMALAAALPHFDARVFQLPSKTEAANAILWRALDARKNAVSMAARAEFPHKALYRKDAAAMLNMLAEKGVDFDAYPAAFKWGTFVRRVTFERTFTAEELERIPEAHRPGADAVVTRAEVQEIAMPEFRSVANRVEVIFDGAAPSVQAASPPGV